MLDKRSGTFTCSLASGEKVWRESKAVSIVPAATSNGVAKTTQTFAATGGESYFGGGQQNGSFVHTGKAIDIVADCNWAEGGYPNPAPWMMARVSGSVVCTSSTGEKARVTFRITTDSGKVIFERVGQKGKDAPQICEVNIPDNAKTLTFEFIQEGDAPAYGLWKNLKLVK